MPRPGSGRAAQRWCTIAALCVLVSSCGKPSDLDRTEQTAFARACTSLIERNLSQKDPPRTGLLERETLDLDDPQAFYEALHRLRGPQTYDLHDPAHNADTARQPLDNCNLNPVALSSLFQGRSSTTTTTPSTATPGS